jgi:phosphate/sulfate permease
MTDKGVPRWGGKGFSGVAFVIFLRRSFFMSAEPRKFLCQHCNNPLPIPKNSKGIVKCEFCRKENKFESLEKNAEIAAKENINSVYPLTANSAQLHRCVVAALTQSPDIPVDVFSGGEIIREKRYYVPAFCFYCNGTASFSYDAGNIRQHKTAIDKGNYTRVEKENYLEWTQMTGSASASATLFSSGNKEFAKPIGRLYIAADSTRLIDYEEYEPTTADDETVKFNFPETASFNEYVKPKMESILYAKAEESLRGRETRNLSMCAGCSVQRDEVVRVFLGLYNVVFSYGGSEYPLWITGDGQWFITDGLPVDEERKRILDEKRQKLNSIPVKSNTLAIVLIVLGIILLAFTSGLSLIATVIGIILLVKNKPAIAANKKEIEEARREIAEFEAELSNTIEQFRSQKKPLRGIYEAEVEGDASAF